MVSILQYLTEICMPIEISEQSDKQSIREQQVAKFIKIISVHDSKMGVGGGENICVIIGYLCFLTGFTQRKVQEVISELRERHPWKSGSYSWHSGPCLPS